MRGTTSSVENGRGRPRRSRSRAFRSGTWSAARRADPPSGSTRSSRSRAPGIRRTPAGGSPRNTTFASHGCVTAPMTISRPGTSASTPHPSDSVNATRPRGRVMPSGLAAEQQLASLEDCPNQRRVLQFDFARRRERHIGWSGDVRVMMIHDVIGGHEPVEEVIALLPG